MPTYDYLCPNGHRFEVIHSVTADGPETCPVCGAAPVRKAFTAPTIHFKGSGWAKKDRSSTSRSAASSSSATDGAGSSGTGGGDTAGSGPKTGDGDSGGGTSAGSGPDTKAKPDSSHADKKSPGTGSSAGSGPAAAD